MTLYSFLVHLTLAVLCVTFREKTDSWECSWTWLWGGAGD